MELIRPVALFLLLFCGVAVGAEAERRKAEPCANGNTHQAGFCPAVLSSASCSATGATTGSCSATSDESDGTRYVCATSSVTALTGAQIEACSGGAAINGSSAAETGSNSVSLSGLTTDAAHYGQIVNESPEGWYSNRLVSSSFTPTDPGGDPYDLTLGGTRSFPSELSQQASWPTAPTTTQTINVTAGNFTSLQNAVNTSGALVNVPAGTYTGTLYITATDVDIVLDDNAIINGSIEFGDFFGTVIRTRWTGGQHTGSGSDRIYIRGDDVLIDNLHSYGTEAILVEGSKRLALINSTIESTAYAYLSQQFADQSDHIFANNEFSTTSTYLATVRIMSVDRMIFVDNRTTSGTGNRALRLHYKMIDAWVANNDAIGNMPASHLWFTESGGSTNTYGQFGPLYISDNRIYSDNNFYADTDIGPVGLDIPGGPIYVYNTVSYNDNYSSNTAFVNEVSTATLTWVNNVRQPYQAPPAFTGGADH